MLAKLSDTLDWDGLVELTGLNRSTLLYHLYGGKSATPLPKPKVVNYRNVWTRIEILDWLIEREKTHPHKGRPTKENQLTERQKDWIRKEAAKGRPKAELARIYKIHRSRITRIVNEGKENQ